MTIKTVATLVPRCGFRQRLRPSVIAPRKAWRLLQGESPCRVRARHPPVSSLASMAESREHGEQNGRGVDSVSCRPQGEPRPLQCWDSFAMALVADAEGFNAHRRQHESIRFGEDGQVRRSPQAVACRKRDVEELGRPQTLLGVESRRRGYTAPEARKGKPGHGTMLEPKLYEGTRTRQAEKYCHRERPLDAPGESSHA